MECMDMELCSIMVLNHLTIVMFNLNCSGIGDNVAIYDVDYSVIFIISLFYVIVFILFVGNCASSSCLVATDDYASYLYAWSLKNHVKTSRI